MKINFKKLNVPTNLKGTECKQMDIAEELGNMIYRSETTIQARRLAEKIYDATSELELNDVEETILRNVIQKVAILSIQDAILNPKFNQDGTTNN